ncbi:MAG: gliding motility-associated C-terminal domain-containing protein [Saprospiraceae bacterium]|nr:gliding motility-associated C-terminal domain-containing protein [Saprospiraceae bacterium]
MKAQIPFTCKGQYFLSLTKSGSKSSGLYVVKISKNGQNIYLDTISSGLGLVLNGMGYRITDNLIYGVDPSTGKLRKVGSDGVVVDLGVPLGLPTGPSYYAGDVTPDGKYLLLIGLGGTPQIVKVDLDDPQYRCTFVPMQSKNVSIVDIAFDPFTGILYGHDYLNRRLVIVNPETGAVNINFVRQNQVDQLGALFFDSFGNLYGYGAYDTYTQDKFVSINKSTGEMSLISTGPLSVGQDGCACPYTLELQKIVEPEITYPCTEVVYSFIVSNGSGATRSGINLTDTMPKGLSPKKVIFNPFGGNVLINNNLLVMSEMIVPPGIDTIRILAETDPDALGLYKNQAILSGLPPALGSFTLSDDPATFVEKDSTELLILPWDLSFLEEEYNTCIGDSVFVDATLYGLKYLWSDGDTLSGKWLPSPGLYSLNVKSLCDEKMIDIHVKNDLLTLNIIEDTIFTDLGNEIILKSEYSNINDHVIFFWMTTNNPDVDCSDCQNTMVVPLYDGYYYLQMINEDGCVVEDRVYVRVNKDRSVYYPNVISANGDHNNDIFMLSGNALSSNGRYIRVYDRWGNLVYQTGAFELNQIEYGWDGTFNGIPLVNGVFTWVSELEYIDGFHQILKGNVTVIK